MRPIERLVHIVVVLAVLVPPAVVSAQSARTRYESALGREREVRQRIQTTDPGATQERARLLKDAQRVIASYEALVRRYPASGYCDNALWQVGGLHLLLVDRFARTESRERALSAYERLIAGYPASSLVKNAQAGIEEINRSARSAARMARAAQPATPPSGTAPEAKASTPTSALPRTTADSAAATPPARTSGPATLTEIQRVVLPEAVRITLLFDQEVAYRDERIAGPDRVFFDLKDVSVPPALRDASLDYGDDVVRRIRVGRHPNNTIRVVLDADGVSRYSVFTLYNPFRVVIDAERSAGSARRAAASPLPPAPVAPAPVSRAMIPNEPSLVISSDVVPAAQWDSAPDDPEKALAAAPKPAAPTPEPARRSVYEAKPVAPAPAPPVPSRSTTPVPSAPPLPPAANAAGGFSIARQLGLGVSRIVIDPGHGGRDPGNLGRGVTEAEVTLDVALRLEKLLQAEPGIEVVLTRRSDEYIPLEERTAIANRESADLFLSIHANASRNKTARGVETFFLSFASSPDAEAVAARENTGSEAAMHNLPDIVKAIALNNKLDESRDFASMVQESLVARLGRVDSGLRDRGVKKAPFVVLIGAGMPSVLAEIAFLSHAQDARLLKMSSYRQRAAEALHAAVLRYRRSLKGTGKVAEQ